MARKAAAAPESHPYYVIIPKEADARLPEPKVLAYRRRDMAEYVSAHEAPKGSFLVTGPAEMAALPSPLLVELYNTVRPERPIKKFENREIANTRMFPALEVIAGKILTSRPPIHPPGQTPSAEDPMTARAKRSAKKSAKKAAASSNGNGERPGRVSKYAGKVLTRLVDKNPRREGTHGHRSFSIIKDGMTYEEYLDKGGRLNDLNWDIAHKFVKVGGKA